LAVLATLAAVGFLGRTFLTEERKLQCLPDGSRSQYQAQRSGNHCHALAHVLHRRGFPQNSLGFAAK
jgi:hypothetical protein